MNREELLKVAKPILFNTEMVRAIVNGRKTATRRCVKFKGDKNPNWTGYIRDGLNLYNGSNEICNKKLPFKPGDILYVRETWAPFTDYASCGRIINTYAYRADDEKYFHGISMNVPVTAWRPSIHMPKEAARIFLKVTDVRVERLQDITPEEARAEGIYQITDGIDIGYWTYETNPEIGHVWSSPVECFLWGLWDSTVKKADHEEYDHRANPWVVVGEFERIERDNERRIS